MTSVFTIVLLGCHGSTRDTGNRQLFFEALIGSRKPISLQVDGTEGRVCEWSSPFEAGGLRQEGVDLTLGLVDRTSGRVQRAVAESRSWV